VQTGTRVDRLRHVNGRHVIETSHGEFEARLIINYAGLFSDRVAHSGGLQHFGGLIFFKHNMAALGAHCDHYPSRDCTKRIPHFRDRSSLCACGPQMIHSWIHRRGGPLFFVISLVPLLLVLWLLRKGDEQTRYAE